MSITAIIDTAESNRHASMCWPRPVRSRSASAARMPVAAKSPVVRSVIAMPAFCGPPPGRSSRSPVTLMKPAMPWMMKS